MPKSTLTRPRPTIEGLTEEVAELRAALDELRTQLAGEVRTRRLVVVGPDGFERITAEADEWNGTVTVASTRKGMHVELSVSEEEPAARADVYLSAGGNVVGRFSVDEFGDVVVDHENADAWTDPETVTYRPELAIYPAAGPDVTVNTGGLRIG